DVHAGAWRVERNLRARIRHGRACRRVEARSGGVAPAQRAPAGRVQEAPVLKPLDAGVLPRGCGALRVEPPQSYSALDARWALADRLGHGECHLPDELRARLGYGASAARWHRRG